MYKSKKTYQITLAISTKTSWTVEISTV